MRILIPILAFSLLASSAAAAADCFTLDNVTELAAKAAGGKKQVLVLLLARDDLAKGDFQRGLAISREKKITMAIAGADAGLVHTVLSRELKAAGKRRCQGAEIVVVGPRNEDPRLRPLLESFGVKFIYVACPQDEKTG